MKLGKLKKQTVKELDKLRSDVFKIQQRMQKRFDKMLDTVDTAIMHVESLEEENKSKKVKPIKMKEGVTYVSDTTKKAKKG